MDSNNTYLFNCNDVFYDISSTEDQNLNPYDLTNYNNNYKQNFNNNLLLLNSNTNNLSYENQSIKINPYNVINTISHNSINNSSCQPSKFNKSGNLLKLRKVRRISGRGRNRFPTVAELTSEEKAPLSQDDLKYLIKLEKDRQTHKKAREKKKKDSSPKRKRDDELSFKDKEQVNEFEAERKERCSETSRLFKLRKKQHLQELEKKVSDLTDLVKWAQEIYQINSNLFSNQTSLNPSEQSTNLIKMMMMSLMEQNEQQKKTIDFLQNEGMYNLSF